MFHKLKLTLNAIKKSKKIKCFFLGNTVKKESSSFYISDIRENDKFIYSTIIIYNDYYAKKICKIIDGKIDFILVDIEKKSTSGHKKILVNLEKCAKTIVKKSNIYTYKGNDLTVQAADTFISNFFIKDVRGVGGKNILILGSGNIGFKIGLKLVEIGANVFLYRRNKKKLLNLVQTINYIKPIGTASKAKKISDFDKILNKVDIIIGSTSGKSVILKKHVEKFKKKIFILDIGKGIFTRDALELAMEKHTLFRLDITPGYNAYLENIHSTIKINKKNNFQIVNKNNILFAKKGILTKKGTLIVDNLKNPKIIYGVSDGFGSFEKLSLQQLKKLEYKMKLNEK